MSTGLPADFDQFQDFALHELDGSSGADSIEDAVRLFRERQRRAQGGASVQEPTQVSLQSNGKRQATDRSIFRQLRDEYIAEGGRLLTIEQVEQEVAERRGE